MDIDKLLLRNLNYWPPEIEIKDGRLLSDINGFKSISLTSVWNDAEEKVKGSDWDELAVWIIYNILHETAKRSFESKTYKIFPGEILLSEFSDLLIEALNNEGYEEMLKQFNS